MWLWIDNDHLWSEYMDEPDERVMHRGSRYESCAFLSANKKCASNNDKTASSLRSSTWMCSDEWVMHRESRHESCAFCSANKEPVIMTEQLAEVENGVQLVSIWLKMSYLGGCEGVCETKNLAWRGQSGPKVDLRSSDQAILVHFGTNFGRLWILKRR